MRCPRCDADTPDGAKFCIECGTPLQPRCPQCGADTLPRAKFCADCGTALTAQTPSPPAALPSSPLRYTPGYLAEKILTTKTALEGERKQVTVLFADLKGSMELLADRDPEEARQLLDPVLEHLMAAVHRYEGTVNQVMGDGIMALFGAPIGYEDHAVRACYAALAMQASVKQYATEIQRTQGVPVQIRVGLNSGEVVVRSIGSDLRMDYTAVGQTTHLAARMEQMAMPGSILITADVLHFVEGYVQVTALGPVAVKGLRAPVDVYEVLRAGPVRTRLQAAAVQGLTHFVGRDTELDQLRQACKRTGAGQGQVVAVIGEPGVGKSRLVWEFTQSHRTQGWLLLESRSVSYGKATAYLPVIDLLKAYCGVDTRDDTRHVREKVMGKLLTLDCALELTLPAILALLDIPVEDAAWHALDPLQRRRHTLEAVKRLLLRESQVQPVLVVFEDLHWIDSETQAVLDLLVESLPTARVLLLVNYRPEYQHGWSSKTYYTQLRLNPLPPASADEFLQVLIGDDPSVAPLTPLLIARTQGNPFFLQESVRTLVATGALVGDRGAYRLATPLDTLQVPTTVQALLAARIDRLPPEDKRLLQTAAVIGTEVPFPLLQAIAELPEDTLRRSLTHLQAAEFLCETRLFPESEYTFKHTLTHEVAYGSLLQERRRGLHARIVEAIEAHAPHRLANAVEHLAHHAWRGEVWEKAGIYLRQAGAKATTHSAYRQAVAYFEQALAALGHLPERRDLLEQAIDLQLDLRSALLPLAAFERMSECLREAQVLAEALGDQRRLGHVLSYLAHLLQRLHESDRAIASGRRALRIAVDLGDLGLQVATNFFLGQILSGLGDYREATSYFRRIVDALEGDRLHNRFGMVALPAVQARSFLAGCLSALGAFAEAIIYAEDAVRIAEAVGHPYSLIDASLRVGHVYRHKGDVAKAISAYEHSRAFSQDANIPVLHINTTFGLGAAYVLSGRVAAAIPLLEEAVEQAMSMPFMPIYSQRLVALSEAYMLAGRMDEAMRPAQQALELARAHQESGDQAGALRLFGELAARHDPPEVEQAEAYYRQAMALAEDRGMRPLQAHCSCGLGKLYAESGRPEPARVELSAAIALYRAMDMTFWLPEAEAALAQVEGR